MTITAVPADDWTSGGTTTVKSIVQCRGDYDVQVMTGSDPGTTTPAGVLLAKRQWIEVEAGVALWYRCDTPGQATAVALLPIAAA